MVITTSVETLDESWIFCYTGFILGRALKQRRLCPIFVKIWIPINGTQQYGIGLPKIHRNFAG